MFLTSSGECVVHLTDEEMEEAKRIGLSRREDSIARKLKGRFDGCSGLDADEATLRERDIEGARAEKAASKVTGEMWNKGVGTFKEADIGHHTQVRSTHHWNGSLVVRDNDKDGEIYVLVIGHGAVQRVVGWTYGIWAKQEEWIRRYHNGPPGYFVPRSALEPVTTLKAAIAQKDKEMLSHAWA